MARKSKPSTTPLEGGGPLQPAAAVILYNRRTGVIFSTHYFSAANDAKLPDKEELERVALAQAANDGCEARTHKVLHVDPAALKPGVAYRVSVAKGGLAKVKAGRQAPKPLATNRSSTSR